MPSSGTSQKAATNVPTMLPAVETEKRRPAVRPSRSSERAASRTAIGVAAASTMLTGANSAIAASSGSRRGPGSQATICSITQASSTGTSSTSSAPSVSVPVRRYGDGKRSESTPPAQ